MTTYNGTDGDDILTGSVDNDIINGGDGNDILDGRAGTDALSGGAGDDLLIQTGSPTGAETLDGGEGTDTIRFNPSPVWTPFGSLTLVSLSSAILSSIERFEFASTAEFGTQVTLPFAQIGSGLAYNAELVGSDGQDSLILLASGGDNFTVPDFVRTNWDPDDFVGLIASDDANHTLRASAVHAGGEILIGGGGNDLLIGGEGTESLFGGWGGADQLFGGGGTDFLSIQGGPFSFSPTDYHDSLFDGGDGVDYLSVSGSLYNWFTFFAGTVSSVEGISLLPPLYLNGQLIYGQANLIMTSTIALQFGPELRLRGEGSITIDIQPGDTMDLSHIVFEEGADVSFALIGSDADDVIVGSAASDIIVGAYGNDIINGGEGDDRLLGDTEDDRFEGGIDTLDGGPGIDTLEYEGDRSDYLVVDLGDGSYRLTDISDRSPDGIDIFRNIEFLDFDEGVVAVSELLPTGVTITGTGGADVISATKTVPGQPLPTARGDTIYGDAGNDKLDGGGGADVMYGGTGDDSYTVNDVADQVVELGGGGTDSVSASVDFWLRANVENLSLTGTAIEGSGNSLDNRIVGNALANFLYGGEGNDTLIGGAGADMMFGGLGNDSYTVDDAADLVMETEWESGTDSVNASVSFTLGANIENLSLSGAAAINGTGNTLDNRIVGNSGANILTGLGGNDALIGGAGADTLIGGQGNDSYTVEDATDQVIEQEGEGADSVSASVSFTVGANVENLSLSGAAAIDGTGNALDNRILGNSGANTLAGLDGNDALIGGAGADKLIGGAGLDTLTGGLGADRFVFLAASDSGVAAKDKITDFNRSEADRIDLAGIDADGAPGDQAFTFIGTAAFSQHAGELRYAVSGGTATLFGDIDGNGVADFALTLTGVASLAAGDFVL